MRPYLDANPIIYSIEGVPTFRQAALDWIERAETGDGVVITSLHSRLECRVKPLRDRNAKLLELFEGFFATLKAIHNATHPAARLKKKDVADDITSAVLRVRPEDPDLAHP